MRSWVGATCDSEPVVRFEFGRTCGLRPGGLRSEAGRMCGPDLFAESIVFTSRNRMKNRMLQCWNILSRWPAATDYFFSVLVVIRFSLMRAFLPVRLRK